MVTRWEAHPPTEKGNISMSRTKLSTALTLSLAASSAALADGHESAAFTATLVGHAVLPAQTLVPAPDDAPDALKVSGKYAADESPLRTSAAPTDGAAMPLNGQPVQGFSGISTIGDGSYYVLTDNGFGSKANSPDAMLFFHVVRPDFGAGTVAVEKTVFLSDPNGVVPFNIAMEATDTRYLTGADFDIEGFQVIGGKILIGDEFGPYVIVADAETGIVETFHETMIGEDVVMSPDHHAVRAGNPHDPVTKANLRRSRGYEGFAKSVDETKIYGMLEGPLWNAEVEAYEQVDGKTALRILEWDVASGGWTGRSMYYPLESERHAIGDFNMIDETRGLVIERDGGQGDLELACKDGQTEGCFGRPAEFKRVYMIDMGGFTDGAAVEKVAYIDLLNIADPDGVARLGKREDGRFTFPFVTIEDVDRVDETHIIVANDNNFPFSKGRDLVEVDNNEMILLEVGDFLQSGL